MDKTSSYGTNPSHVSESVVRRTLLKAGMGKVAARALVYVQYHHSPEVEYPEYLKGKRPGSYVEHTGIHLIRTLEHLKTVWSVAAFEPTSS